MGRVKLQQNDRTSTIEIDGSQVHFNSPLSHQDGFDHTVNGVFTAAAAKRDN